MVPNKGQLQYSSYIINLIIKALIYSKGISKFKRELIGVSDQAVFKQFCKKGFMGKLYNIVKYIIRTLGRHKDFAKYQAEASAKDKLFNPTKLLLIKDRGIQ